MTSLEGHSLLCLYALQENLVVDDWQVDNGFVASIIRSDERENALKVKCRVMGDAKHPALWYKGYQIQYQRVSSQLMIDKDGAQPFRLFAFEVWLVPSATRTG